MPFEFPTSPFLKNAFVINFQEGDKALYRKKLEYKPLIDDDYHITNSGDSLDSLAFKYYNDSKYWWIIADINEIENPFVIESGLTLLIPKLKNFNNV